jgi:shikimate dehydrogenase
LIFPSGQKEDLAMQHSSKSLNFGLLGEHLSHSLSPQLHQELYQELQLPASYHLYEQSKEEVLHLRTFMEKENLTGLNVTIPYKETILPLLDEVDVHTSAIGAVNTILKKDNRFYGYNTDYLGATYMFTSAGVSLEGASIVILGAGGACKALIYGFHLAGASKITVVARRLEALHALSRQFPYLSIAGFHEIPSGDILVNTTPVGMYPNTTESPVPKGLLQPFSVVGDIVYNPLLTTLLQFAKEQDKQIVTGISMMVEQGLQSEEIWLGRTIPSDVRAKLHQHWHTSLS